MKPSATCLDAGDPCVDAHPRGNDGPQSTPERFGKVGVYYRLLAITGEMGDPGGVTCARPVGTALFG